MRIATFLIEKIQKKATTQYQYSFSFCGFYFLPCSKFCFIRLHWHKFTLCASLNCVRLIDSQSCCGFFSLCIAQRNLSQYKDVFALQSFHVKFSNANKVIGKEISHNRTTVMMPWNAVIIFDILCFESLALCASSSCLVMPKECPSVSAKWSHVFRWHKFHIENFYHSYEMMIIFTYIGNYSKNQKENDSTINFSIICDFFRSFSEWKLWITIHWMKVCIVTL